MKTFRLTFTDRALNEDGQETLIFYSYVDIDAHTYDSPRPGKHDFFDETGDLICSYRDASISVDQIAPTPQP